MSSFALYHRALSWHCFDGNAAVDSLCVETRLQKRDLFSALVAHSSFLKFIISTLQREASITEFSRLVNRGMEGKICTWKVLKVRRDVSLFPE